MQIVRLVRPGHVDRIIGFDSLPERLLNGVESAVPSGLPRHWKELAEKHYYLFYITDNNDKDRWQQITNYVKKSVLPSVRLLDRMEDMAVYMAPDSKAQISIEPENVPIIPLPPEIASVPEPVAPKVVIEEKPVPEEPIVQTDNKAKHICKSLGRRGDYMAGCPRCDQLKEKKLIKA